MRLMTSGQVSETSHIVTCLVFSAGRFAAASMASVVVADDNQRRNLAQLHVAGLALTWV